MRIRSQTWHGVALATCTIVLALPILAGAQDQQEFERLSKFLSLPAATVFERAENDTLPIAKPLRVFVATDAEPTAGDRVRELIAHANRDGGGGPGLVEVRTLGEADVVLVQFEAQEKRRIEPDNRLTMDPSLGTRTQGGRTDPVYRSEIRSYVLVRTGHGYRILNGNKRSAKLGGRRDELRNAFSKVIKRGNAH